MEEFIIHVGNDGDGYTYALHPKTKAALLAQYPDRKLPTRVFLGDDIGSKSRSEESQKRSWGTLVEMLAGIGIGKFDKDIPVTFHFPISGNTYKLKPQVPGPTMGMSWDYWRGWHNKD